MKENLTLKTYFQWGLIICLIYGLLLAVGVISGGFQAATGKHTETLFEFASNPVTALLIGIISTALIQSSSTVTSVIVGLVAGGLPIDIAIPMIMGANVGTTITNTIVSLGHLKMQVEFKRAFAAATIHDFFNLISVIIFLPLEILFGLLEKTSAFFTHLLVGGESIDTTGFNFIQPLIEPIIKWLHNVLLSFGLLEVATGIIMIVLGISLIFFVIAYLGSTLKSLITGQAKNILHTALGKTPIASIASGALITALVQSSSTTTSLIVPMAGSGVVSLKQVYPFTLGVNIGTTITALLAATALSGPLAIFALQIAFVHLFYNLLGIIVIYSIPFLRELPLIMAIKLADLAAHKKRYAVLYVLSVFFVIPLILIVGF